MIPDITSKYKLSNLDLMEGESVTRECCSAITRVIFKISEALYARQAALDRQAVELKLAKRALEDLEITLEKRDDSLA